MATKAKNVDTTIHEWDIATVENAGVHPAADIFPEMTDGEYAEFRADVEANGLLHPIVTTGDGQILDGRHRWRACMELTIDPRYQVYRGNPWTYVVSANLHRRQLTDNQRAMVAARLATRTPGQRGQAAKAVASGTAFAEDQQPTRVEAAKLLHVSDGSVGRARQVLVKGIPELAELVEQTGMPITTAGRVASTLDREGQLDYVKRVRSGEDPLKAAPFSGGHKVATGKRHSRGVGKDVFTREHVENLGSAMVGIEIAFGNVSQLDNAVTPDDAKKLLREMTVATKVINRIKRLLATRLETGTE